MPKLVMPINVDDLFEIVKSVWTTVVEVDLERVDPTEAEHTEEDFGPLGQRREQRLGGG